MSEPQPPFSGFERRKKYRVKITQKDISDVRNPDLIIEVVELFNINPNTTEKEFSKGATQFHRATHLAKQFGLLEHKELTNKGRALLELESKHGRYTYPDWQQEDQSMHHPEDDFLPQLYMLLLHDV